MPHMNWIADASTKTYSLPAQLWIDENPDKQTAQEIMILQYSARISELEKAITDMKYLALGAVEEEMTTDEFSATLIQRLSQIVTEA